MAENSNIEWTDHTFNPWMGCTKVSPACDNCYAERDTARFKQVEWGPHAPRKRTSPANWKKPLAWNRKAEKLGVRFKVFCASLADVFDNHRSISPAWRQDLWELIEATPNLDWLLLTKRPQNIAKYIPSWWLNEGCPDNVWLGTTAENQEEADRRIPHLLGIPAKVHFLSCEPLLGPIDLISIHVDGIRLNSLVGWMEGHGTVWNALKWIICGGESGPNARPMHPDWARSLRDQCARAGVPFLFKQWGEYRPAASVSEATLYPVLASNRKAAGKTEKSRNAICMSGCFHMEHQVAGKLDGSGEFAYLECAMAKVGKKAAGRMLDGVPHDGQPEGGDG